MNVLNKEFYNKSGLLLAPELLGKILVRKFEDQEIVGRIVEVEAYLATEDEAAHAFKGETKRTKSLFLESGIAYIYSIHQQVCLDVVTKIPTSVLIRALMPLDGIELMKKFRGKENLKDLTSGPGKLTKALGIPKEFDGINLTSDKSQLYIADDGFKYNDSEIGTSKRIGISKAQDFEYRFFVKGNPYLSR